METPKQEITFMTMPLSELAFHFARPDHEAILTRAGKDSAFITTAPDTARDWLADPEQRHVVMHLIEKFFRGMKISELKADESFTWEMKLKVDEYMAKVYHRYQVHFVPDPSRFYRDLDNLKDDEREILANVQEEMPLEGDQTARDKALANISRQRLQVQERLQDQRRDCPEISFEGTVSKSEWPTDGTVLRIVIPASVVNMLNDNRMFLKDDEGYLVRLEKIGD